MLASLGKRLVGRQDLARQFARYRATVAWAYRELFRFSRARMILALATNVAGVTLQGGALALLVYYANLMERNAPVGLGPLALEAAPRDIATFLVAITAVAVMLLASAGLIFVGNMLIIRLAVGFGLDCSKRTLILERARPPRDDDPSSAAYPKRLPGRATAIVGIARAVRPLLRVFNPAMLFVYSTVILLYIDWSLTLIVGVLITPSLLLQYKVNYLAAQNQKRLGKARGRAQTAITGLLNELAWAPAVHASERGRLADLYAEERIEELPRRYSFRVAAQPYSQVISDVLIALVAVGVTGRLGALALSGEMSWSWFIGFLVFARIALTSLRGMLGAITGFARHYPRLRQSYELFTSVPEPQPVSARKLNIQPRGPDPVGDLSAADLQPGRPVAVVSLVPVSRFNLYAFVDALAGRRARHNRSLRANAGCCPNALNTRPGGSLAELLGMPSDAAADAVWTRFRQVAPEAELPAADVHAPLDRADWQRVAKPVRAQILLDHAARNAGGVLVVAQEVLRNAPAQAREAWWPRVADRFLAVRYGRSDKAGAFGERTVLALGEDRAVSLMSPDWARANAEAVEAWLGAHAVEAPDEADDELDDT